MQQPRFPALYISKVATDPRFQGQGLSMSLRRIAHEIAHQLGIRYMIGTTIEGTPRIRTLKAWGYRFVQNPRKWSGSFKSDLIPVVGVFDSMESYAAVEPRDLPSVQMAQAFFKTYRKVIDDWFTSRSRCQ
jgi:GNAT superfamily N-acetyltransferase